MKDIYKTETEEVNGIKYTTHYVNRPIRQGDPQGGSQGICTNGVDSTVEVTRYIYQSPVEDILKKKIEEAAEKEFILFRDENPIIPNKDIRPFKLGFIKGALSPEAKEYWQQGMYTEEQLREITLEFFFHWYNSPGANTYQGFDDWWKKRKEEKP